MSWTAPKHVREPDRAELEHAAAMAEGVSESIRIGDGKAISVAVIGKLNRHLAEDLLVTVRFVKLKRLRIEDAVATLEKATKSRCVRRHGCTATFYRPSPNRTL